MRGNSVEQYDAPLFVAWQLTNRCNARCRACCEESGPDKAWVDELSRDESLDVARRIVAAGVPYVAFGGGEPLGVPHFWEVLEVLSAGGVALKLETNGAYIDDEAADRLTSLAVDCIQISVDGAGAATHEKVRPGSSFASAIAAIERLVARGQPPQLVFVPNRLNLHETLGTYDLARRLGCEAFVTGPMMQIGRAAADWKNLACQPEEWERTSQALQQHGRAVDPASVTRLSIYPWDIVTEMERRLESPQAMLLVVPNGKVKLLNALPFVAADLRRDTLSQAWRAYCEAWRMPEVRAFVSQCRALPEQLLHANATWSLGRES